MVSPIARYLNTIVIHCTAQERALGAGEGLCGCYSNTRLYAQDRSSAAKATKAAPTQHYTLAPLHLPLPITECTMQNVCLVPAQLAVTRKQKCIASPPGLTSPTKQIPNTTSLEGQHNKLRGNAGVHTSHNRLSWVQHRSRLTHAEKVGFS